MPILLAFAIIALSAIAITYKTYMGYSQYVWHIRLSFFLLITLGWSAPILGWYLHDLESGTDWLFLIRGLYFLFGFVVILFIVSFIRDILWTIIDLVNRVSLDDMKDSSRLNKANLITAILCLLFCFYGLYEAEKMPTIKTYDITSAKIKKPTKVVMLSDLHIDVNVSPKTVKKLVDKVNEINPDVVVISGDIIDNTPAKLNAQMEELKKLKTKENTYVSLGNHEFYSGALDWIIVFAKMGFSPLNNYGMKLGDTGIYIAGIPDINAANSLKMKINSQNTLFYATPKDYVILLSHTPKVTAGFNKNNVDLILSGHTHGGQIYPFHYISKKMNDGMLAGFYEREGIKMYVSRGTRYWGPPMRIFAPSEITIFNLNPENK